MAIFEKYSPREIEEKYKVQYKSLVKIYEENDFKNASQFDFPIRKKYNKDDANRRYLPKVLLGFGKYGNQTLYQVFLNDFQYFEWLFKEKILQFDSTTENLSNKVRFSKDSL